MTKVSTSCDHCGLPMELSGPRPDGPIFCCIGCQAVYHTLHEAGLEDFYSMRQSWSSEARPIDELPQDDGSHPSLRDEDFALLDDGTRQAELQLEGVHCAGCVWLIERMPQHVDGVVDARLDLARGRLTLRWAPETILLTQIAKRLSAFGYRARPLRADGLKARGILSDKMLIRVGICWAIASNVMLMTIAIYAGLNPVTEPGLFKAVTWTIFGLSTASLAIGGSVFFRRALANLRAKMLSMDVPISIGILVGYLHSVWVVFTGSGELWFDSIVVLIAALLTARYLQIRGNGLAADAAERLIALLPSTARRVVGDEVEIIAADALTVGDRVEVRAGDIVPADGCVFSGSSNVSRAVLTGESLPERITAGQIIEAGTTNLSSPLYIDITATGEDTRLGRLMHWVRDKGRERAPIVQLADRLGSHFTAAVLLAALLTGIAWAFVDPARAVANVVALLVIACPCALGMATPLALTVGVGRAAKRGIHIKHDDVIEALAKITDVVFDKTGTLTEGQPGVVDFIGDENLARLASALETRSSHPIAGALLSWAKPGAVEIEDVEEVPGAGIMGKVDGRQARVGRLSWFENVNETMLSWADEQANKGFTPVAIEVDGKVKAVLAVGDALRPEAAEVVADLHDRGINVHLLSGDHARVVSATGRALGIDPKYTTGAATPEEKLVYIETLAAQEDTRVAMIGDGVNDAAALQAATVGIAVHGGAEANLVAADVFLVRDGLGPVDELLSGARSIMHVVRRNLIGSGLYNAFGISLAAAGFITPLAAAVLMPISSLAVVASSLLQRSFEPPSTPPIMRFNDDNPLFSDPRSPGPGSVSGADLHLGRASGSIR